MLNCNEGHENRNRLAVKLSDVRASSKSGNSFARYLLAAVVLVNLGTNANSNGITSKCDSPIAQKLSSLPKSGWTSVILKLDKLTPDRDHKLNALGCDIYRRLPIIRSVAARIPNRNLPKVVALSFVQRVSLDGMIK